VRTFITPDAVLVFWSFPEWVTHDPTIPPIYIDAVADDLCVRARNGLARAQCRTLGDVARLTKAQLLGIRNLGHTSVRQIEDTLNAHGLTFAQEKTVELPDSCRFR